MQIQPVKCLGIVLSLAWFFMLTWQPAYAQQAAADKSASDPAGVRMIDTTVGPADKEGAASQVREASDSNQGVPTLAPKRPGKDAGLTPVDPQPDLQTPGEIKPATDKAASTDSAPVKAATKPASDEKPAANPKSEEKLSPIADPEQTGPVELEATSFHGVTPGTSSIDDMDKAWGTPKELRKQGKTTLRLYALESFPHVEATCNGDKVTSIVVRFGKSFPAAKVAQQLDLAKIQPVLVSNDLGEILGEAFPERGVMLAFEPGPEPGKPSLKVTHIMLEAISAEPFVLRAETNLDTRPDFSLRDLDQALKLQRTNARAHWLRCRVLASCGEYDKAVDAGAEAIRLDPHSEHYRVTQAKVLAQAGLLKEAADEAHKAVELSTQRPHVKARALCLLGDLAASGSKPDYRQALQYHFQAVQMATPLVGSQHPAIRIVAKEVMLDAHLGAAHDIAWGDWREKEKAVGVWLDKASGFAEDLIHSEGGSTEFRFRVSTHALAACVGLRGKLGPDPWISQAADSGKALIASATEPGRKAHLQWDLGMSLYDAMQLCQMHGDHDRALKFGQVAADYLEKGSQQTLSVDNVQLLGRLYFRLGAIYAVHEKNHNLAVNWFDKALPLMEKQPPGASAEGGLVGQSFVSMGVSYWETGQREKAVQLTEHGVTLMEQATAQGRMAKSALNVPYKNLASMHRQLGQTEKAIHFEQLAGKNKGTELR